MLAKIDDLMTNIRVRLHSRAIATTAQGYIHTALTSFASYYTQPFVYYSQNQQHTGTVKQRNECSTQYLLETPYPIWEIPLPYRGVFMFDEFRLRVTEFKDFCNIVVFADTVEVVSDERNHIDFEAVIFYPYALHNTSVQQSTSVIECTYQIVETMRLHNVNIESVTEYPRFAAEFENELLGEYILYRVKCKYYN